MSDLDDIARGFLLESHEGLDRVDRDLVAPAPAFGERDLPATVFRACQLSRLDRALCYRMIAA